MRVRRFGKSYAHPFIVLIALPNQMDKSRFAITAGRSIGNSVQRNRAKRILRETLRSQFPEIASGWDVVLMAREPMNSANFHEIKVALRSLLYRANLIENPL
jgi:ribonuclease P protein component